MLPDQHLLSAHSRCWAYQWNMQIIMLIWLGQVQTILARLGAGDLDWHSKAFSKPAGPCSSARN